MQSNILLECDFFNVYYRTKKIIIKNEWKRKRENNNNKSKNRGYSIRKGINTEYNTLETGMQSIK